MKLSKEQLNSLIGECVEEKIIELKDNMVQSTRPEMTEALKGCSTALENLKSASMAFKKIGVKTTEIDNCYFTLRRFMESQTQA